MNNTGFAAVNSTNPLTINSTGFPAVDNTGSAVKTARSPGNTHNINIQFHRSIHNIGSENLISHVLL